MDQNAHQDGGLAGAEGPAPLSNEIEGGYWGEHPKAPVEDWRYEVANNDTRQGYWEWVASKLEGGDDDPAADIPRDSH